MTDNASPKIITVLNHVDSLNLGDASMTYMIITLLNKVLRPDMIYVLSYDTSKSVHLANLINAKNVVFISSPARTSNGNLTAILSEMLQFLLWSITLRLTGRDLPVKSNALACKALKEAQFVAVMGGDFYSDTFGSRALFAHLYNTYLALILKKKLAILGTSIGPFQSNFLRKITYHVLRKLDHIIVRDLKSENLLKHSGFNNFHLIPDIAFDLPIMRDKSHESMFSSERNYVGIGTNSWIANHIGREKYASLIADLCDKIIEKHRMDIIFICHVLSDLNNNITDEDIANDIVSKMKNKKSIMIPHETNPMKLKYIISKLDLLISARMHPIIHAFSVGTPVIGINYNVKIREVMKLFEKEEWVIDYENLKGLTERVDLFFNMKHKDEEFYKIRNISITEPYVEFLKRYNI